MKIAKTISIKFFILFALFSLFVFEGVLFYSFYKSSEEIVATLLKNNIQTDLLHIKHFLAKNIEIQNLNKVTAALDNVSNNSNIIRDIHIINNNHKILYTNDRNLKHPHPNHKEECMELSKISTLDSHNIFTQRCYTFKIRLYKKLEPYYYTTEVYMESHYLNSLLQEQFQHYVLYFLLFILFYLLVLWISFKKILIVPLEQLRQFAYYSLHPPKNFLIQELESIRYSLFLTFKRLRNEQEELYKLSTQDALSGLYNRLSLIEKLNWLITKSERSKEKFAIIFLDLDNFKNINDSRGHNYGDKILKYVSEILLKVVRSNDIVSRIGGDEFVIVLPELHDETRVIDVAQRIKKKLSQPVIIDNYKHVVTASMGITIYPKDGKDVTTLLKNADIAMYKSKDLGKNSYSYFTDSLNKLLQEKLHIQQLMQHALEEENFKLFYQPKVDIKSSKIIACEALIRIVDPKEGVIYPNKFIPLAEQNNFIVPLGEWIIKEATQQLKAWQDTEFKDIKISINLSSIQFQDSKLIETIKEHIKDIDPSKLDIELTESVFMTEFEEKIKLINKIKELGISLSLDDFGTGYSSLSYLKTIPFNTIKIDKSFIDDIESNQREKAFINMIVNIADELQLDVVAEGVERQGQLDYLRSIRCEQYQGNLCSKPLPLHLFEILLKNSNCP